MSKGRNGKLVVWVILGLVILIAGFTRILQGVYNEQRRKIAEQIEAEKAAEATVEQAPAPETPSH